MKAFDQPIHECIYVYTQLSIYPSNIITHTFGWVYRGAAWRVRIWGWNESHYTCLSSKLR